MPQQLSCRCCGVRYSDIPSLQQQPTSSSPPLDTPAPGALENNQEKQENLRVSPQSSSPQPGKPQSPPPPSSQTPVKNTAVAETPQTQSSKNTPSGGLPFVIFVEYWENYFFKINKVAKNPDGIYLTCFQLGDNILIQYREDTNKWRKGEKTTAKIIDIFALNTAPYVLYVASFEINGKDQQLVSSQFDILELKHAKLSERLLKDTTILCYFKPPELKRTDVKYRIGLQTLFFSGIISRDRVSAKENKTDKKDVILNINDIISYNYGKVKGMDNVVKGMDYVNKTVLIKYNLKDQPLFDDQPSFGIMKAIKKCKSSHYVLYSSQIYGKADNDKNLPLSSPIAIDDRVEVLLRDPFFNTQPLTVKEVFVNNTSLDRSITFTPVEEVWSNGSDVYYDVRSIISKWSSKKYKSLYDINSVVAVQPKVLSNTDAMFGPALQKATILGVYDNFNEKLTREYFYLVELKN